jgi:hypothetical protein
MRFIKKFIPLTLIVLTFGSCAFFNKQIAIAKAKPVPFSVDRDSPNVAVGQIEAQFNNAFPVPGIRKLAVNVFYYPYEDAVCLNFRINSVTYYQFWHKEGRSAYAEALQKYNDDFSARKLQTSRTNRTKNRYGTVDDFYLIWQLQAYSVPIKGNMEMEFGYYFREGSPFFSVTQLTSLYDDPIDTSRNTSSPEIPMFFSREQAQLLAAVFSQDFLESLPAPASAPTGPSLMDRLRGYAPQIRPSSPAPEDSSVEHDQY